MKLALLYPPICRADGLGRRQTTRPPELGTALFAVRCYHRAMPRQFDDPAVDLANMPSLGVRSIFATCDCGRAAAVDVSKIPAAIEVPSLCWRLRCSLPRATCRRSAGLARASGARQGNMRGIFKAKYRSECERPST